MPVLWQEALGGNALPPWMHLFFTLEVSCIYFCSFISLAVSGFLSLFLVGLVLHTPPLPPLAVLGVQIPHIATLNRSLWGQLSDEGRCMAYSPSSFVPHLTQRLIIVYFMHSFIIGGALAPGRKRVGAAAGGSPATWRPWWHFPSRRE